MTKLNAVADVQLADWQSYTPTISAGFGSGGGAPTNIQFFWRRVGDTLEVYGRFNAGTVAGSEAQVTFPSGLSADATKLNSNERIRGRWTRNGSAANESKSGPLIVDTANLDRFKFSRDEYALANNPFVALNGNSISNNNDVFVISATVPIVGWSSNLVTGERAVEEYAADDGSSDVFGPNGVPVPNVGIGTTVVRDFVFQTSRQDTDAMVVEYKTANAGWAPVENYLPGIFNGTKLYGIRGFWNNPTTFRVVFGNGGALSDGAAYGDNSSTSWQSLNIAGERWRVRKVSGGAVVGYPIGARNVLGDTTGTAVPAGYIGELIEGAQTSSVSLNATAGQYTDVVSLPSTLSIGVWEIEAYTNFFVAGAAGTGINGRNSVVHIATSGNSVIRGVVGGFTNGTNAASGSACYIKTRVIITSPTSYKLRAATEENASATTNPTTVSAIATSTLPAYIRAVRIA